MERGKKEAPDDKDFLLHRLFEQQASLTPEATALSDENTELTYRELDHEASLLARRLRELGAAPDSPIGIYMERSAEYVIAMLAAMKAGGAYLPLELAYPASMLEEIIEESKPTAVLTKKRFEKDLPPNLETISLDAGRTDETTGNDAEISSELPEASPENLAFIAYSSGTTGKPKGIANSHRAAATSYFWRFETSDYGSGDRVGCNVFFVWEALRPLLRGGASHVIPDDVIYDPRALVELLAERGITETLMTPSLLETTLNNVGDEEVGKMLPSLRTLWLNGEVVTKPLASRAAKALPDTRLLNVYSISEAHEVAAGDLSELMKNPHSTHCPVGRPISPKRTYVLDEEANPVPDGEDGELFVGGECLAREYIGLPEKTAERFLNDPFAGEGRMYKTGDRARLLSDGNLEILGRCDFMVKIRGYSIELGAVEAAIEESLPVEGCVVVADGEEGEDKRLVAYLVPEADEEFDVDARTGRSTEIRHALKDTLPHYAIPAAFVVSDSLPLQETTGKVDRTKLPPPPERSRRKPVSAEGISISENPSDAEVESVIARVWESVLRLDEGDVSADDNFFDIGGHSLAAAETLAKIEDIFDVRLPMSALLDAPTPSSFRKRLSSQNDEARDDSDPASDAVLDDDISPRGKAAGIPASEAKTVFLTGATGFLGAFLLDEILRKSDAEVHCLVRRRAGSPLRPIHENMERYALWRAEYAGRITPVPGDLGEPRLGIEGETFAEISGNVDVVFHAAAAVNLVYPYSALKGVNVDGTREVLRLCCEGRPTPLHHVSTNGVFPPGAGECLEGAHLDALDALDDGYAVSKWVAEKMVWEAADRGLPVCVHRPGNVSGHSVSGASNPRDFLTAMLSESVRIEAAPEVPGWRMEMTPVDFVAGAVFEISERPDSFGKAYHLANPEPPLADEIFDLVESLGTPLDRLEIEAWMEERSKAGHSREDIVGGVLGPDPNPEALLEENRHDDSNTRQAIEKSGVERPAFDAEVLGNYLRHFERMGWVSSQTAAPRKRTA
ncbi:MAG: amino acid adenylation domain-containing protein [Rubrobacter sp.]|nr:amino acid adenylation domain-containing protein [Rubrobacter sp.]